MKRKYILPLLFGVALAIGMTAAAAAKSKPKVENNTVIVENINYTFEILELSSAQEKEVEYKPSTAAGPGYISELQLIEITEEIGNKYGICPELLQAMCETESTLYINAENGDCKGLMQISQKWHKERMQQLGVTDIFDPYSNILLAADFLDELKNEGGQEHEIEYVLMRYNMAIDTANELWAKGETTYYARSIVARAAELERLHGK